MCYIVKLSEMQLLDYYTDRQTDIFIRPNRKNTMIDI